MHIWTNDPVGEVWQQLRYFKSSANVRNLLTGAIESRRADKWSSGEAETVAEAVASCVAHADEYFQSSRVVGLATKPLLQFYGVESLAKAMILASSRGQSLETLRYHGLNTRPSTASTRAEELRLYAESPSQWAVEREFAVTHAGVFPELAVAAGDARPATGVVVEFSELLRMIPDLAQTYERHYGTLSHCARLYSHSLSSGESPIELYFVTKKLNLVRELFPEFAEGFDEVTRHDQPGFRSAISGTTGLTFGTLVRHSVAGDFLVRPHLAGFASSTSVLFASSFILSNIVRYKPAFWMRELQGDDSGVAPMVGMFCNLLERRFPQDVLEALWAERFTFGSPGYLA